MNNKKEDFQSRKEESQNKREDFQKKPNNHNNFQGAQGNQVRKNGPEQSGNRERNYNRNHQRDNYQGRNNHSYQNSTPRYAAKPKAVETVDDIRVDISRIEKEIELEIKEIKSLRLGI